MIKNTYDKIKEIDYTNYGMSKLTKPQVKILLTLRDEDSRVIVSPSHILLGKDEDDGRFLIWKTFDGIVSYLIREKQEGFTSTYRLNVKRLERYLELYEG